MSHPRWIRPVAAGLAALLLGSCFSVQTKRRPLDDGQNTTGGVALRVYADDDARRAAVPGPRGLFVELERRAPDGSYAPVFRSLEPAWSVMGLPAGSYRLRFPARLDESGNAVALDEKPRAVSVRQGEVTEVSAVLEHVSRGWIAAGIVTAVVAAVLLEDWLDDNDLPLPPVPPLPPPPPAVLDAIFYVTLDIVTTPEVWHGAGPAHAPVVTSYFPPSGALVAARRVRVTFALSEPLAARSLRSDGVTVLAEKAGLLKGATSYDGERWWIVWQPDEDLPRGDVIHVTLAADTIQNVDGDALASPSSVVFRTAP